MTWAIQGANAVQPVRLPPPEQHIGSSFATWFPVEPGVAVIRVQGGTIDDRWLAYAVLRDELATAGIQHATFSFDEVVADATLGGANSRNTASTSLFKAVEGGHFMVGVMDKTAAWPDIMAKAKRLIQSGNVTLLRNGYNNVVAHVIGDHGEYTTEISRDDPESRAITQWTCECPWDQFAFQRTRQWKKYEGRPCAHVLAAYWKSLATPLDDDAPQAGGQPSEMPPGGQGPRTPSPVSQPQQGIMSPQQGIEQGYQPSLPVPGQEPGAPPMGMPGMPQMAPGVPPPTGMPAAPPAALTAPLMAPPADLGLIPPQLVDQQQMQLPVSVPGGRPGPYPANPVQQPGTFSHRYVCAGAGDAFSQGMKARLNEPTLGQSEGRDGATDAGQWMEVPRNAMVEVRDQDATTGWVEIIYPLRGGPMTSYHVRCFVEPEKLTSMEGPSPFQNPRRMSAVQIVDAAQRMGPVHGPGKPYIYNMDSGKLYLGGEGNYHMHVQRHPDLSAVDNRDLMFEPWMRGRFDDRGLSHFSVNGVGLQEEHRLTPHKRAIEQALGVASITPRRDYAPQDLWESAVQGPALTVQVHTPESLDMEDLDWIRRDNPNPQEQTPTSLAMIYDANKRVLHVGSEDEVHHGNLWDQLPGSSTNGYPGYISYRDKSYQWYRDPPDQDKLHQALVNHLGFDVRNNDPQEHDPDDLWS